MSCSPASDGALSMDGCSTTPNHPLPILAFGEGRIANNLKQDDLGLDDGSAWTP